MGAHESDYLERTEGGRSFTGTDVDIYRAIVLASALELYARTKLRVNRAYTPSRMLQAAGTMLGRTFKRGQYQEAATMLRTWAEAAKRAPRRETLTRCEGCGARRFVAPSDHFCTGGAR